MLDVLKTTPGVVAPTAGVLDGPFGPAPAVRYTWESAPQTEGAPHFRPTVTYWATGNLSRRADIQFMTERGGLGAATQGDAFGDGKISRLWKERCGVTTFIEFM